jgi:hypothetical protein
MISGEFSFLLRDSVLGMALLVFLRFAALQDYTALLR